VILDSIIRIEAAFDVFQNTETLGFKFTLSRDKLRQHGLGDWAAGKPRPTHFKEKLQEYLKALYKQRIKEEAWVSSDAAAYGGTIPELILYWNAELQKLNTIKGHNIAVEVSKKIIKATCLRLGELDERRQAGGVYREETKREKARRQWAEDEYEAPRREEEQRKQQQKRDEEARKQYQYKQSSEYFYKQWKKFEEEAFTTGFGFDTASNFSSDGKPPPPPPPGTSRKWFEILGCSPSANGNEIRKAARAKAKGLHPDTDKTPSLERAALFKEISDAKAEGLDGWKATQRAKGES
jgi:hypothetical protein